MRKLLIILSLVIMLIAGIRIGVELTLRQMHPYTEGYGVVVVEVFGQEWVYEE